MQGKCMRAGEAYAAEVYAGEVCGTEEMTHGFVRNLGRSLRIVVPFTQIGNVSCVWVTPHSRDYFQITRFLGAEQR